MPKGYRKDGTPLGGNAKGLAEQNKSVSLDNLPPNRNAEIASYIIRLKEISTKADRNDVQTLRKCFSEYLKTTAECDMRVGNMACYMALGIPKDMAKDWRYGKRGKAHQEFIQEVDSVCSTYREITAATGEANTIWSIFAAKNYDGMKDTQDVVVAPANPLGDCRTAEEIAEKYKELPE